MSEQERDHKKIGRKLDLFVFSDLVGPGLPLWTPRGTILRKELDKFVQDMRDENGFQEITTPHITKNDLYKKSGHWDKFSDELFKIKSREGHEFAMKPMNCPHHSQIYASRPRSYRDLPIRYRETTMDYRDEQTGELNGILRPRAFTQDDAHVFCRQDQIHEEVLKIWDIVQRFYGAFEYKLQVRLSRHDPKEIKSYRGEPETWGIAEEQLQNIISEKVGADFIDGVGEAAFYGPKIDFMSKDSLGREWQVATIQLDFAQPEGLGLTYTNESGEEERPVMIHCAIMGSIERFLGIYIEHTEGRFPLWLSPEQLRVMTINDEKDILKMAENVVKEAKTKGLRVELDSSNESIGKKIASAEAMKVPYMVVIGAKELESGTVELRSRADLPKLSAAKVDELLDKLASNSCHP